MVVDCGTAPAGAGRPGLTSRWSARRSSSTRPSPTQRPPGWPASGAGALCALASQRRRGARSPATSRACWGWPRAMRAAALEHDPARLAPRPSPRRSRAARRPARAGRSGARRAARARRAEQRRRRVRDAVLLAGGDPAAWPNAALALAHLPITPGADARARCSSATAARSSTASAPARRATAPSSPRGRWRLPDDPSQPARQPDPEEDLTAMTRPHRRAADATHCAPPRQRQRSSALRRPAAARRGRTCCAAAGVACSAQRAGARTERQPRTRVARRVGARRRAARTRCATLRRARLPGRVPARSCAAAQLAQGTA